MSDATESSSSGFCHPSFSRSLSNIPGDRPSPKRSSPNRCLSIPSICANGFKIGNDLKSTMERLSEVGPSLTVQPEGQGSKLHSLMMERLRAEVNQSPKECCSKDTTRPYRKRESMEEVEFSSNLSLKTCRTAILVMNENNQQQQTSHQAREVDLLQEFRPRSLTQSSDCMSHFGFGETDLINKALSDAISLAVQLSNTMPQELPLMESERAFTTQADSTLPVIPPIIQLWDSLEDNWLEGIDLGEEMLVTSFDETSCDLNSVQGKFFSDRPLILNSKPQSNHMGPDPNRPHDHRTCADSTKVGNAHAVARLRLRRDSFRRSTSRSRTIRRCPAMGPVCSRLSQVTY